MKQITIAVAILALVLSACGRRAQKAPFDAAPATPPPAAAGAPAGTVAATVLPEDAISVRWDPAKVPASVAANSSFPVTVTFTNTSSVIWPDKKTADPQQSSGAYAVRVGYAWTPAGSTEHGKRAAGVRGELPKAVAPGEKVSVPLMVMAPAEPGEYELSFELVQELAFWFTDRGADALIVPVRVTRGGA